MSLSRSYVLMVGSKKAEVLVFATKICPPLSPKCVGSMRFQLKLTLNLAA